MFQPFGRGNLRRLMLAAVAGVWLVPPLPAQTASAPRENPTKTSSRSSPAAHSTNSSTAKKTAHSSTRKTAGRKRSKKVKGQTAPTPERITAIQEALAKQGAFTGVPSGKWDDSTTEAMKKFQSSNGLNPTGKLDAVTLQKLGSETAGVAAPMPPANATANRLLSRAGQREELKNADPPQ
jgi:peptidoglycan hydrolase-like protein with peptidoglycan-binding domain